MRSEKKLVLHFSPRNDNFLFSYNIILYFPKCSTGKEFAEEYSIELHGKIFRFFRFSFSNRIQAIIVDYDRADERMRETKSSTTALLFCLVLSGFIFSSFGGVSFDCLFSPG